MLRIAVYSCSLDEEKFVERWANSARDADQLLVLDTGSTDRTVQALHDAGVMVGFASIRPWRFDDARNASLHLLSPHIDVAIQLDLDEVLTPNWRAHLEAAWQPETTRLHYRYVWSHTADGRPDRVFFADKISGRHTHRWVNPVHEVLTPTVPESIATCPEVLIEHFPDPDKSRGYYLDLLQLAVREDPQNDRSAHYLGREFFFHQRYDEAIAEFRRHLLLPTARWQPERAASLRYGGKSFDALGNLTAAENWFTLAVLEDTQSREALIDLSAFLLRQRDWLGALHYAERAHRIPADQSSYINERYALEEGPYDLAAIALHEMGQREAAVECAHKALVFSPTDARLRANLALIEGSDNAVQAVGPEW